MHLQSTRDILYGIPGNVLKAPEVWKHGNRPAAWMGCPGPEELFGEWLERRREEEVVLSPELDAAYDRAIDAAFEKVKKLFNL